MEWKKLRHPFCWWNDFTEILRKLWKWLKIIENRSKQSKKKRRKHSISRKTILIDKKRGLLDFKSIKNGKSEEREPAEDSRLSEVLSIHPKTLTVCSSRQRKAKGERSELQIWSANWFSLSCLFPGALELEQAVWRTASNGERPEKTCSTTEAVGYKKNGSSEAKK